MKINDDVETNLKISEEAFHKWVDGMEQNPIITICGSTKFKEEYLEYVKELSEYGAIVLYCPIFTHADDIALTEDLVKLLTEAHMKRIKMCDIVFIINKNGYIGDSTKQEIEYAISLGKEIVYMEPPLDITKDVFPRASEFINNFNEINKTLKNENTNDLNKAIDIIDQVEVINKTLGGKETKVGKFASMINLFMRSY